MLDFDFTEITGAEQGLRCTNCALEGLETHVEEDGFGEFIFVEICKFCGERDR